MGKKLESEVGKVSSNSQLELILTRFNTWENDAERDEYIDSLEEMLETFNVAARKDNPIVPDAIYDTCKDYLRELKPDSKLLHQVWTDDDPTVSFDANFDKHLITHPMLSIQTIKGMQDKPLRDFQSKLPLTGVEVCCSVKENGHGIRVVWEDTKLVKGASRGRATNGRDLTKQMKILLGEECDNFKELGLVELRGEALLPFDNLDKARLHNPKIKSAFSGVASMIRESAPEAETRLLDVVFYDIICDKLNFNSLAEKFDFLDKCGFITPQYFTKVITRRTFDEDIEDILTDMDLACTDYPYHTDGIVMAINDNDLFTEFGSEDSFRLGNLALKMGRWRQDDYIGTVGHIEWVNGKSKKTPVAVLEEGVLTATGNTVTNIPLYAPCYILLLEAYPGRPIHFKYGGEAGVVPVMPDGRLVTDKSLKLG